MIPIFTNLGRLLNAHRLNESLRESNRVLRGLLDFRQDLVAKAAGERNVAEGRVRELEAERDAALKRAEEAWSKGWDEAKATAIGDVRRAQEARDAAEKRAEEAEKELVCVNDGLADAIDDVAEYRRSTLEAEARAEAAEKMVATLREVLGDDQAGRPLAELLRDAARFHVGCGGGPLSDCLFAKAEQVEESLAAVPAEISERWVNIAEWKRANGYDDLLDECSRAVQERDAMRLSLLQTQRQRGDAEAERDEARAERDARLTREEAVEAAFRSRTPGNRRAHRRRARRPSEGRPVMVTEQQVREAWARVGSWESDEDSEDMRCPTCDGEGYVDGVRRDATAPHPATLVGYGIGKGLEDAEVLAESTPALLETIDTLRAQLTTSQQQVETLRQLAARAKGAT